jgi:hypothetical protein
VNQRRKIILLFAAVALCAAGVAVWAFRSKKQPEDASGVFPLRYGSRGEEVKNVQRAVNALYAQNPAAYDFEPLAVDGIWGDLTDYALKRTFLIMQESLITQEKYNNIMDLKI